MEILNYILDMGGSVVMPIICHADHHNDHRSDFRTEIQQSIPFRNDHWNRTHRNQPDHRADGRLCKSGSPGYGRTIRH